MIVMDPTWSGSTSQLHFTVWYITWYPSIGVATRVWVRRVCCQPTWPTPASSSAASYSLSGSSATSSSSSSSPHQSPWGEYKVVVYFQNTSGMATYFLSNNDNRDNINKNCNKYIYWTKYELLFTATSTIGWMEKRLCNLINLREFN